MREWVDDGIYHVFSRGSNRQAISRDDEDRADLLRCLVRVLERHEIRCLGYTLMTNHSHYLLRQKYGRLSPAMRELNGRYALRFNKRHGLTAHVFRNRFGAVLQETSEQLIGTARYIVMNPVKAGLCRHPEEWLWSSYRATAGLDPCPPFLSAAELLSYFSDVPEEAVRRYVEVVTSQDEPVLVSTGV